MANFFGKSKYFLENYLKYNKALYINQISKGYGKRIKKITSEIIIVSKNSEYIIFKSLDELKKSILGTTFSRNLSTYLIASTLYKSELFFLFANKKLSLKNIVNIQRKIKISFNPNNFQENKDIVRSIGKPMMVDEFLAKIQ